MERLSLQRNADARAQSAEERAAIADQRAAKLHDLTYRAAASDLGAVEATRAKERSFTEALGQSQQHAASTYGDAIGRSIFQDELKPTAPIPTVVPDNVRMKDAVQGPTRPGFRVGSNDGKTYATKEAATAEAQRRYSLHEHFMATEAPKYRDYLMMNGEDKKAEVWDKWIGDADVKDAVDMLGDAQRAYLAGDHVSAVGLIQHALNNKNYFDDGNTYGFQVARDEAGNEVGIEGFAKNDETGKMEMKRFGSLEELYSAVIPIISPRMVFEKAAAEVTADPADRELGIIGTDEYGNEQRGLVDKRTGKATSLKVAGQGATGAVPTRKTPGGFELVDAQGTDGAPVIVRKDHWEDQSRPSMTVFDPKTNQSRGMTVPRAGLTMVEAPAAAPSQAPMFKGTSVEAQALNELVRTNKLTREQAAKLGAGKTITGPNGQIIFMTPDGVFSRPQEGAAPATTGAAAETAPEPQPGGMIPLTERRQVKMPAALQKEEADDLMAMQSVETINSSLGKVAQQIDSGELDLGLFANFMARGKNYVGASDESSRNYASFVSTLEKLRNESLRLNKGVQTEGDSVRAWNEMITNINDPELVKQRIAEISELNASAASLRRNLINQRRETNGMPPIDPDSMVSRPGGESAERGGSSAASDVISQARDAISRGASRDAVIERLRQNGYSAEGL